MNNALRHLACVLALTMAVVSASACAKARAQTVPDGPPLAVPPPPDRVIAPPEEPVLAAAPPAEAPGPVAPTPSPSKPTAKPQPTPTAPAVTATTPPPVAPPVVEAPKPSPPTAAELASDRRIREILRRASRDIGRVTYSRLSTNGKSNYDQSKSLSEQAEQAIKDRNWAYAETLADKAALLAAELVGR